MGFYYALKCKWGPLIVSKLTCNVIFNNIKLKARIAEISMYVTIHGVPMGKLKGLSMFYHI